MKTEILICHPYKHHIFNLVAGVSRSLRDYRLVVPLYCKGAGKLLSKLPGRYSRMLSGYYHPDIDPRYVISPFVWQCKRLTIGRRDGVTFIKHFDTYVAEKIRSGNWQAGMLVTMQDYMPESVCAAKELGWTIFSDQIINQSEDARGRISQHYARLSLVCDFPNKEAVNDVILSSADVVTTPSSYCARGINGRVPEQASLFVVPYGVSSKFAVSSSAGRSISDGEKIKVIARANSVRKGGHLLLQALSTIGEQLVAASRAEIEIIILGKFSPELDALKSKVNLPKGLSLIDRNIPHADVPQLMSESHLFIMPSLSEGMSLVCVEALKAGIPVLSSKYCGVDALLDGKAGACFGDSMEELADAMVFMFSNKSSWGQYSKQASEKGAMFSWAAYEESIGSIFREIG